MALGDVLPGLSHCLGRVALGHPRVDHPPAEGRVVECLLATGEAGLGLRQDPGCPAHGFDAPRQIEAALAEPERPRRLVDGLEPGGAEPVHGDARDLDWEAGEQRGHPRDVAVVLAGLVRGTHVDVVDVGAVDPVALDRRSDDVGGEVVGTDPGEGASVGPHRGSERVDDHGVRHGDER